MKCLIGNNCLTWFVYKKFNRSFDSPFFSNRIFCKDFTKLLLNFNDINFLNVDIDINDKFNKFDPISIQLKTFSIIINDYNIRVFFNHNRYSKKDLTPRKEENNVYYRYNYKYTYDNYIKRAKRINKATERLFVYHDNEVPHMSTIEDKINLINTASNSKTKLLYFTSNKDLFSYSNEFVNVLSVPSEGNIFNYIIEQYIDYMK